MIFNKLQIKTLFFMKKTNLIEILLSTVDYIPNIIQQNKYNISMINFNNYLSIKRFKW